MVATMFDHIDLAVQDIALSRAFYVAALAPLGIKPVIEIDRPDRRQGTGFGFGEPAQFYIGGGRPVAGRFHVARLRYDEHYYSAYVLDPDGHVVEAVCRAPA